MTYNIHTSIEAHVSITMITSVWRRSDFDDMKSITFARFNPNLFTRYYIITNSNYAFITSEDMNRKTRFQK